MRIFGFIWGITGVIVILLFAIYRISPMVAEMQIASFGFLHWAALLLFAVYMAYAEGYKGFHLGFAPRVVQRAAYLRQHSHPLLAILAPLFCMGYFHATRRRVITSFAVTLAIILLVVIVSQIPQPWRGIVDFGVVTGLLIGIGSILLFTIRIMGNPDAINLSADLPDQHESVV
ncbi:MAG: hypothetical protein WD601_06925 [Pseudohongiellaceae bacterium]